jgi:hypothetical protein
VSLSPSLQIVQSPCLRLDQGKECQPGEDTFRYTIPRSLVPICIQTMMRMIDVDTTLDEQISPRPPRPHRFITRACYEAGACCRASSFTNVLSSVMIPPAVSRGTAGSRSRSPPAFAFASDDVVEGSARLFSTSERASQSTFSRRPFLRYNQNNTKLTGLIMYAHLPVSA